MSPNTVVTTAKGEIIHYSDVVSKFVVAHPKAAALIALVVGFVLAKVI